MALTLARFVLVPWQVYFITHNQIFFAIYAYAAAAVSDLFAGYLARRWNQRTPLGAALDPLAPFRLVSVNRYAPGLVASVASYPGTEFVPVG